MFISGFGSRPWRPTRTGPSVDQPAIWFASSPTGAKNRLSCYPSPHPAPQEQAGETLALRGQSVLVIVGEYFDFRLFYEPPELDMQP